MTKKKVITIIAIAAALVVGRFVYGYFVGHRSKNLVVYGNVEIRQVNLAFKVDGILEDVKFEEGDTIKEGELLALLDSEPYKVKLSQAKARYQQSKISFDNANIYYKRNIELCAKKSISKQECDDIETRKKEAEADMNFAKGVMDEAQLLLDYTSLYAPNDGIIITRINEKGTVLGAGMPIYTLTLTNKMWIRAFLEESMLGRVQLGTKVTIHNDSGRSYNGHIGFISPVAEFTPKNIETPSLRTDLVYRVRIVVDDADDYLKQGMPVTVNVSK